MKRKRVRRWERMHLKWGIRSWMLLNFKKISGGLLSKRWMNSWMLHWWSERRQGEEQRMGFNKWKLIGVRTQKVLITKFWFKKKKPGAIHAFSFQLVDVSSSVNWHQITSLNFTLTKDLRTACWVSAIEPPSTLLVNWLDLDNTESIYLLEYLCTWT
jgi:hypothetical protein